MQYKHSFTLTDNVFYKLKVCGNLVLTDDGWKFFQVKIFFFSLSYVQILHIVLLHTYLTTMWYKYNFDLHWETSNFV